MFDFLIDVTYADKKVVAALIAGGVIYKDETGIHVKDTEK